MSDLINKAVFEKSGVPLLQKFLDIASLRHKLVAGNIANVSTPGYQSKDINFHEELKAAVDNRHHVAGNMTHPNHIPVGKSREKEPEVEVNRSREGNGINNVNADKEVANLATNQLYYSVGTTLLARKFEGLRTAIKSK
jgi:flagellar basal-body rod protein FlgB